MSQRPRAAHPDDAEALCAIDARVSSSPWSSGRFERACAAMDESATAVLVLAEEDRVDGFVVFSRVLDEASILNIAVHDAQQRKGLGRILLRAALDEMKRCGVTRCLLEVRDSNNAARDLYQGQGFQLDAVRKNYYPTADGREDALLMSREI